MYTDYIKESEIKPKLNLKWYNNEDLYSEGDIEDKIVEIIASNPPEQYGDAVYDNFSWSTYYHLSGIRKNILNWYPFKPHSSVLEIGCGLGAITGMLCDRCETVTAVELSKRRATGALLRCREKENLEVIVGNLNDIEFDKKYDYITLIGVLEYQGSYTDTDNPYKDFIEKIKGLLKPDGTLLIAIENQYGLKYWCGANEDHTGRPFDGINQYATTQKGVRTFSKQSLRELIESAGISNTFFYYPMPDYKLPTVIYSEKYLPKNDIMNGMRPYYIPKNTKLIANEKSIYEDVIKNNVFEFFANSFLVECSMDEHLGDVVFSSLGSFRQPEYRIGTSFTKDGKVIKYALDEIGSAHIKETYGNAVKMRENGLSVLQDEYEGVILKAPYVEACTLDEKLAELYLDDDEDAVWSIFDKMYADILKSSKELDYTENILYTFGLELEMDKEKYGPIIETGYLDMIPRNAFWKDDQLIWFDQEWTLENVPARFVMYRAIVRLYKDNPKLEQHIPSPKVIERYSLDKAWGEYQLLENLFSDAVIDNQEIAANLAISHTEQ